MEHYRFSMNLHPIRDSDIISFLQNADSRQGIIKDAIRKYILTHKEEKEVKK